MNLRPSGYEPEISVALSGVIAPDNELNLHRDGIVKQILKSGFLVLDIFAPPFARAEAGCLSMLGGGSTPARSGNKHGTCLER